MRSEEKNANIGKSAPGLAALASVGVLACVAFVLVGGSPSAHAQRPSGADLGVRSLVAPAIVNGSTFSVAFTVANRGDRAARRWNVRAFLSQDTLRGRGDVRLRVAMSIPPLAPSARARQTGTATIPRATASGRWFLIVCAAARRDANDRNDCRRSPRRTTVWNYPDARNTGPTGPLTESTGNVTVSTAGAVIQNRRINGCVTVHANNVTIRNSEIRCNEYVIRNLNGNSGLVIEDTLIECGHGNGDTGVTNRNYTIRRSEVFGCENNLWASANVLIEDNYIHDTIPYDRATDPHTDSIQMPTPSSNITIRHNTIYGGYISQQNFGNSAITSGQSTNVLVTNNLLAGGGYTMYCPREPGGFTWSDNRFSRILAGKVGGFGPVAEECGEHTHSGNVYHETGDPLKLR